MMRSRFEGAYRATSYSAHTPLGILTARIGEPSAALDALLAMHDRAEAAFITAWNPRSQQLDVAANRARLHELVKILIGRKLPVYGGAALPDRDWPPEPLLLVLGLSSHEARTLGRQFEQNAVVAYRRGQVPELIWCDETDESRLESKQPTRERTLR